MDNQPTRDPTLWKIAKKRTSFKRSLYSYLIVIAFLWGVWYFTNGRVYGWRGFPWPLWVMLGWGLGLAFQYFDAYGPGGEDSIEKEYDKLKKDRGFK